MFDTLKPNWGEAVRAVISYSTDVFESRDGTEQRRSTRSVPREELSFKAMLCGDEYRDLIAALTQIGSGEIAITDFRDGSEVSGYLDASTEGEALTGTVATVDVRFMFGSGQSSDFVSSPAPFVLDGREVMRLEPNFVRAPNLAFLQLTQMVDHGSNRFARRLRSTGVHRTFSARWLLASEDEIAEQVSFFRRMAGRRGEFFYPIPDQLLEPKSGIGQGETTIDVASGNEAFNGAAEYPAIVLRLIDGRLIMRKIASIVLVGEVARITVENEWITTEPLSAIRSAQWLMLARFGDDDMTLEYATDTVAQVDHSVKGLTYAEAESPITLGEYGAAFMETPESASLWPSFDLFDQTLNGPFRDSLLS